MVFQGKEILLSFLILFILSNRLYGTERDLYQARNVLLVDTIVNSQQNPDTIYITQIDTVVIENTIVSYYKLNFDVGYSTAGFIGNAQLGVLSGYDIAVGADYIRENFFISSGIKYRSHISGQIMYRDNEPFINQRDTVFTFQQLIDGQLVNVQIPTQYHFIDTMEVTKLYQNTYRFAEIPVVLGRVIDKGRFSILTGIGLKFQMLLGGNQDNTFYFEKQLYPEKDIIKPFNVGLLLQNQSLYYISDRLAAGLKVDAVFYPASIYKKEAVVGMRKMNFNIGLSVSYIL